ncbi:acyltransferase family protein [Flavobacterium faecale]|uniref:acyltransferase family protein n=1 Tax=Flavobacterium faecale TaxID=1355330 RepID=UPI003AACCAD6
MKKYFYSEATFTSSTWALLAITRFLLAFIVMISFGHLDRFVNTNSVFAIIREFGGKGAVMVFLMISGISVGVSIMKSKEGFLKRRFLRIYPLYFMAVLLTVFLQFYLGSPYTVKDTTFIATGNLTSISNFLLLQGIASISLTYNSPLWSISVEFFLYLILPFIYKLRLPFVYLIALLSVVFYVAHTQLFALELYGVKHLIYAWPFIIGYLVAVKKQFYGVIPLILIGTAGIYYNFLREVVIEKFTFIWFLLTTGMVISFLFAKIKLSKSIKEWFNYLGELSYPLYLFHIPLYFIGYHIGIREAYLFVCFAILLCIPINYIFDIWLKNKFWKPLFNNFGWLKNRFSFPLTDN